MNRAVLLVEDDPAVQRILQLALREEGFTVAVTATGGGAADLLAARQMDVVLLDLMLPDMDGLEVCRRVRHVSTVPLMIITARSDSHDVVAGLEAGADDYVVKPFVAKVLSARIRALLRRSDPGGCAVNPVVEAGPLRIHRAQAQVLRDGRPVSLTRTEFLLLSELAARIGEVVSRTELLQQVWGYDYLGDGRLVDVHIRRLRSKIEQNPSHPAQLVTVRGLGYRLVP